MLLREAIRLAQGVSKSSSRQFALVCSFEPLHFKTYLQAFCVQRFPKGTPVVVSFGFDQLAAGLEATQGELGDAAAVLALSWEDIHPALSWRSRGSFTVSAEDINVRGQALVRRVVSWVANRRGLTLVLLPPRSWLAFNDFFPPGAVGPVASAAGAVMWQMASAVVGEGARVLEMPTVKLNFRDLLQAGHPMTLELCKTLAERVVAVAFPAVERRKVLVLDLDGTLWHGVIGEDGPQGISCRSEGAGFPFHVFQRFLAKIRSEGVLLAFCTKNNPSDVLPAFDSLEILLRLKDFSAWRCNWDPKPQNLRAIATELNVGVDSLVFVDDNEAEIAEMSSVLPEVAALRTPRDGSDWPALFEKLQTLFGAWNLTDEDRLRSRSLAERPQPLTPADSLSATGHLRELELALTINGAAFTDPRSLELINKTNQFNLTGERLSRDQWLAWASAPEAFCLSVRLTDRFGDFGTIGVVVGHKDAGNVVLRQLVLSCRAFGRRVEVLLLGEALHRTRGQWLRGPFKDTGKNEPVRRFLAEMGCEPNALGEWQVDATRIEAVFHSALEDTQARIAYLGEAVDAATR